MILRCSVGGALHSCILSYPVLCCAVLRCHLLSCTRMPLSDRALTSWLCARRLRVCAGSARCNLSLGHAHSGGATTRAPAATGVQQPPPPHANVLPQRLGQTTSADSEQLFKLALADCVAAAAAAGAAAQVSIAPLGAGLLPAVPTAGGGGGGATTTTGTAVVGDDVLSLQAEAVAALNSLAATGGGGGGDSSSEHPPEHEWEDVR